MSNIEKIRQEIENCIKAFEFNGGIYDSYEAGELSAYKEIMDFIDSLPEEKPSEDLEEAAEECIGTLIPEEVHTTTPFAAEYVIKLLDKAFIAGAKWQREQMMEEAVEGKVFMSFAPGHNQMVMADVDLPTNTKVKLIIVKED